MYPYPMLPTTVLEFILVQDSNIITIFCAVAKAHGRGHVALQTMSTFMASEFVV